MTSADIAEFVAARLGEDEAAAKANIGIGHGWQTGLGDSGDGGPNWPDYQTYDSDELEAANDYLDRFRPLRMLRETAAKRARLALMIEATAEMDRLLADANAGTVDQAMAIGRARAATVAVKHDAAIWSEHPDYRPSWAPAR